MIKYSQRDKRWADKIYSARPPHTETIRSSGCGITSAAMVIANLTDNIIMPPQVASFSIERGYRIDGVGTDWGIFPALAEKYNLNCIQTSEIDNAIKCVKNGGMVVCSTYGYANGLFSTGGHIFLMTGYNGVDCLFFDTDMYYGKYNVWFRKNKARVIDDFIYVHPKTAKKEIVTYFMFTKKETKKHEDKFMKMLNDLIEKHSDEKVKNAIESLIEIQEPQDWKNNGSDYLHNNCNFSNVHDQSEPITFGTLGTILSKYNK